MSPKLLQRASGNGRIIGSASSTWYGLVPVCLNVRTYCKYLARRAGGGEPTLRYISTGIPDDIYSVHEFIDTVFRLAGWLVGGRAVIMPLARQNRL